MGTKEICVCRPQCPLLMGRLWPTALDNQNSQGVVRMSSDPQTVRGINWSLNILFALPQGDSGTIPRCVCMGSQTVPGRITGEVQMACSKNTQLSSGKTPMPHSVRRCPGTFEAYWPEYQQNWRFPELRQSLFSLCWFLHTLFPTKPPGSFVKGSVGSGFHPHWRSTPPASSKGIKTQYFPCLYNTIPLFLSIKIKYACLLEFFFVS